MNYPWIEEYCLSKKGAEKEFKMEWGALRYLLFDKMFVMQGDNNHGIEIITVKLKPERGELLRMEYPESIFPGYYMNKTHWNSLDLNSDVPDQLVREMIDESYMLIFQGLTRAKRLEIELLENESK